MLTDIEKIKARHAKELAQAQRGAEIQCAVTAALNLTVDNWSAGYLHPSPGADCYIVYQAETLPDALLIAEKLNPLSMSKIPGGGFCSFRATDRLTDSESELAETIGPYTYEIGGSPYGEERELRFLIDCAGYRVQVRVAVKSDPLTARLFKHDVDKRGTPTRKIERVDLLNKSGYFPRFVSWSTGSHDSESMLYKKFTLY